MDRVDNSSKAIQLLDENHWPEICCLICVANAEQKKISSTQGMKNTTDTSELLKYRESVVVPKHMDMITTALNNKDWNTLCEVIMKESNSLHAVCLDTYPPNMYMNDTTKSIIELIHDLNKIHFEPVAAYTVDAGANCFLITKRGYLGYLLDSIKEVANLTDEKVRMNNDVFIPETEAEHFQVDNDALFKLYKE